MRPRRRLPRHRSSRWWPPQSQPRRKTSQQEEDRARAPRRRDSVSLLTTSVNSSAAASSYRITCWTGDVASGNPQGVQERELHIHMAGALRWYRCYTAHGEHEHEGDQIVHHRSQLFLLFRIAAAIVVGMRLITMEDENGFARFLVFLWLVNRPIMCTLFMFSFKKWKDYLYSWDMMIAYQKSGCATLILVYYGYANKMSAYRYELLKSSVLTNEIKCCDQNELMRATH